MKILWIFLVFIYSKNVESLPSYRLPGNVKPTHYILEVLTELEEPKFGFSGDVWIKVECLSPTNSIVLHSKNLTIKDKEVTVKEISSKGLTLITVKSVKLDKDNEFLTINLDEDLKKGAKFILRISFSGPLQGDLVGYYRSSYVDKNTNTTRWLAVTNFEPTDARKAFPCFDEPEMKSKFTVKLAHKKHLKAVSNMPLIKTTPFERKDGYVWSHFEDSVPMSTYLVAYKVSDFEFKEAPARSNNVTFRIWTRKDALSQTEFATEVGPKVLEFYEGFFEVKYPLPKQDMAAIPDFSSGAMENWGLITYRESCLLYDPKSTSKSSQQNIGETIAHELAHQWFGNLVTMKWWTDLWLNEGFATYIGVWGIDKLYPEWRFLRKSIMTFASYVYDMDSLVSSHPISKVIGHPNEISQIFDTISYYKGSLVIRMMHLFLGDSFQKGVVKYLKKFQYANAEQNDLWAALTEQAHADGTLDKSLTVKEVMDTWTLQTGYPLVTVTRDYAKGTAKLTQTIYLRVKPSGEVKDTSWWIPITYTTEDSPDFNNTTPKLWMNRNKETVELTKLDPKSWLLLNINIAGLYRVNYDDRNWKLLTDALNSDNYTEISTMNRADLLLTVFDLAWTGDLNYTQAIPLIRYLVREKEFLPWKVTFDKIYPISKVLRRTSGYSDLKDFMAQLMTPIYKELNKLTDIPEDPDRAELHVQIRRWATTFDIGNAVKEVEELFDKWMETKDPDHNNPIPNDLRTDVYWQAIWYGGIRRWEFLLQRYRNCNVGTEKDIILSALASSRDVWVLNRFLEWSIEESSPIRKQDSSSVFYNIAAGSIGYHVACDFLQRRIKDIYKYHSSETKKLGIYVETCAKNIIYEDELKKFKEFVSANNEYLKGSQLVIDQGFESAQANINWYNKNYKVITNALKS